MKETCPMGEGRRHMKSTRPVGVKEDSALRAAADCREGETARASGALPPFPTSRKAKVSCARWRYPARPDRHLRTIEPSHQPPMHLSVGSPRRCTDLRQAKTGKLQLQDALATTHTAGHAEPHPCIRSVIHISRHRLSTATGTLHNAPPRSCATSECLPRTSHSTTGGSTTNVHPKAAAGN